MFCDRQERLTLCSPIIDVFKAAFNEIATFTPRYPTTSIISIASVDTALNYQGLNHGLRNGFVFLYPQAWCQCFPLCESLG